MGNDQTAAGPRLGAVILAAGMSRRMGRPKALLDLGGKPLIFRLVETVIRWDPQLDVVVVTGHEPQAIRQALACQPVRFAHNPGYSSGEMLSSVKTGVIAVRGTCEAFVLMLLDQPILRSATLEALWQEWEATRPPLLAPAYKGKRGHPILVSADYIPEVLSIPPTGSLYNFVSKYRERMTVVDLDDPGVVSDVDTPDDYHAILKLWQSQST